MALRPGLATGLPLSACVETTILSCSISSLKSRTCQKTANIREPPERSEPLRMPNLERLTIVTRHVSEGGIEASSLTLRVTIAGLVMWSLVQSADKDLRNFVVHETEGQTKLLISRRLYLRMFLIAR